MSTNANFIGDVPQYYDEGLGPVLFNHFAQDLGRRAAAGDPASILELAAGTGLVTTVLAGTLSPEAIITATDLNQPMLDVAQRKLHDDPRFEFKTANALTLPFESSVFDRVLCQFGIMFFPDKLQSLQEACRVLKPGGHYIFSVWRSWEENPVAEIAHQTIANFFKTDPPKFYELPFGYHNVDEIESLVRRAGFNTVTNAVLKHDAPIEDFAAFSKALVYGNPIREEVLARNGNPDEVVRALELSVKQAFGKTKNTPLEAIIFTATK